MAKSRLLFHAGNVPSCNEMFIIIERICAESSADVWVLADNEKVSGHIRTHFMHNDFTLLDFYDPPARPYLFNRLRSFLMLLIVKIIGRSGLFGSDYLERQQFREKVKTQLKRVRKIVESIEPDCLIVRGDRHIGNLWEACLLRVCGERGIKRVIFPVASSSKESLLFMRRGRTEFEVSGDDPLYADFRNQICFDEATHKYLLFKKPMVLKVMKEFGILSENPWVLGGGKSDVVMVEGESAYQRLITDGCPEDKLIITGHGAHDRLHRRLQRTPEIKEKIYKKYNLNKGNKLVILALPQLAEHKIMSWEQHWHEIEYLCQCLEKTSMNVLISLHPRVDRKNYEFLAGKYRLVIADERLIDILPVATVFLSCFSSTTEWSILSGIPTIAFDFYGFDYNLYDQLSSLITVKDKQKFENILKKITEDKVYIEDVRARTEQEAYLFGTLDGKCFERMKTVFFEKTGNA